MRRPMVQLLAAVSGAAMLASSAQAAPAIRLSASNRIPACATPERLTAFLVSRNSNIEPRFRDIARWYKYWGDAWRVRWDYAFFQMIIETNALKFRRGDGRRGDVHEKQNNFAGIGATGGGVPGDRFPDVETGVHAQIQHLVAYSGERLTTPIAPRTAEQQDNIIRTSLQLRRPVTYGDLARRWAADRAYSRTIDAVAEQFRSEFCGTTALRIAAPAPQPAARRPLAPFSPPYRLGGPKPSKLAGPETLPWASPEVMEREYNKSALDSQANSTVPDAPEAPRAAPPVRTIWSRKDKINAIAAPEPASPVATSEPDLPALPHFRIAPEGTSSASLSPPSRLGGPRDVGEAINTPLAQGHIATEPPQTERTTIPRDCKVLAASYGGKKTLLVRAKVNDETRYTALTVLDGFEKSMFETYARSAAPGAEVIGEYGSKDAALADAYANCKAQ